MRVLAISVLTTASMLSAVSGDNAYIYYTNAQCSDSSTISGTFNLGYDNEQLEGLGVTQDNYEGQCFYFQHGKVNIQSGYEDIARHMVAGYCCDGTSSSEWSRWVRTWRRWINGSSSSGNGSTATEADDVYYSRRLGENEEEDGDDEAIGDDETNSEDDEVNGDDVAGGDDGADNDDAANDDLSSRTTVGCSPTPRCDVIWTSVPVDQPVYTMSMTASNIEARGSSKSSVSEDKYRAAQVVEAVAIMRIEAVYGHSSKSAINATIAIGTVTVILALIYLVVAARKRRAKRERKHYTDRTMSENFAPGSYLA